MGIGFNQVPSNLRVPFAAIEFDSSNAQQGSVLQVYRCLVLGQKLSTGTKTANVPVRVTSKAQASEYFGRGSMLHAMLRTHFENNTFTETWVIPLADNGTGVAATGVISITGPATADGTLSCYIAGEKVEAAVISGETASQIATKLQTAIAAALDLPVTAAVDGTDTFKVNITARHKGLLGNGIDIRFNYQEDENLPSGVGVTITAMSGGTTAPDLAAAIAAMGDTRYNVLTFPYTDTTSLTAIEAELDSRFGPMRQLDGFAVSCKDDTHSNLGTFGGGRNSKHVQMMGTYKMPTPSYVFAAGIAAVEAYHLSIDPARPLHTLEVKGVLAPALSHRFDLEERNLLLFDGISTHTVDDDGTVRIEGAITMYQKNEASEDDTAFLRVNTLATLAYLRDSYRSLFRTKYPRHKLANDGTRYGEGQAIITPKIAKSEIVGLFGDWELMGLVEGAEQFKRDLIVERSSSNPDRLDVFLAPDLVNQFTVLGTKIGFLL